MTYITKSEQKEKAFKLYAQNKSQKEIGRILSISENTIGKWKKEMQWDEKLKARGVQGITADAYLLVSEFIRQQVHQKTSDGEMKPEVAGKLNEALTTMYRVLNENNLV